MFTQAQLKELRNYNRKLFLLVYGKLLPEENCPSVRVGVWVKVRVSFGVGGQPDNCPRGKMSPVSYGVGGLFSSGQLS